MVTCPPKTSPAIIERTIECSNSDRPLTQTIKDHLQPLLSILNRGINNLSPLILKMAGVQTKKELEHAQRNKEEKITVEGDLAQSLLKWSKLRNASGVIVILASLFALPVKNIFTESKGIYSGPAPGFRYPLSSGSPPTLLEIVMILIVFAIGILILWAPWSRYKAIKLSEKPLKLILLRK